MLSDITICFSDCQNQYCHRNRNFIDESGGGYAIYADLSPTCEEYEPDGTEPDTDKELDFND